MNDLEIYFRGNTGRLITKWEHYFSIYDRHFSRFREKEITILEIGVSHGGSLQMWKKYFGKKARVVGVDINPDVLAYAENQIELFVGDQADRKFLRNLAKGLSKIDILIDDGGHTMRQQIATFEELFSCISENGIYLCEDTHTSYWKNFGGGFREKESFIEYMKLKVDELNAWSGSKHNKDVEITEFTKTAKSMHFYDSIVVVEKGKRRRPITVRSGRRVLV